MDQKIRSGKGDLLLDEFVSNADNIIAPVVAGNGGQPIKREFDSFGIVLRKDDELLVISKCVSDRGVELNGRGQHESIVVVGVFAD